MPENIKYTDVEFTDVKSEAKNIKKIKFAQRSYAAFISAVQKIKSSRKTSLTEQYANQFGQIENTVGQILNSTIEKGDQVLSAQIDKLASIGVRIVNLNIENRRLQQIANSKPIKLGKAFIKNIKNNFEKMVINRAKKIETRNEMFTNYRNAGEEILNEIRNNVPESELGVNRLNDYNNFVPSSAVKDKKEQESGKSTNSLFDNMFSPSMGAETQITKEKPVFGPASYSDGMADTLTKIKGMYTERQEESKKNEPVEKPNTAVEKKALSNEKVNTGFNIEGMTKQELQALMQQCNDAIKQQDANNNHDKVQQFHYDEGFNFTARQRAEIEDLEAQRKEALEIQRQQRLDEIQNVRTQNHDRVERFHYDEGFNFTPSQRAEIEALEAQRREALEIQRHAEIEKMEKQSMFNSLMSGNASIDEIRSYLESGRLSQEELQMKLQDPNLSREQLVSLYRVSGVVDGINLSNNNKLR